MNMEELLASYDSVDVEYMSRFREEEKKEKLKLFSFIPTREEAEEIFCIKELDMLSINQREGLFENGYY